MAPSGRCVLAWIVVTVATLHSTAAYSVAHIGRYSPDVQGPCFEVDLKLWPVKPESSVCGTDGLLYPSSKALQCSNYGRRSGSVEVQERDRCGTEAKPYNPCLLRFDTESKVCGSDNVTYIHIFEMACTASQQHSINISVQSFGECIVDCPKSFVYNPVCSSNGRTFANEEALKCRQILRPYANTAVGHVGKCQNFQKYDPCERYFDPDSHLYNSVCASNGRTYKGSRDVACLKQTNPALGILHEGACTVEEVKRTIGLNDVCKVATNMTRWSNHLCGSDNVTYNNAYDFLCVAKSRLEDNKLTVAYEGECFAINKCPNPPPPMYPRQVCTSEGTTYPNENDFKCAKFENKSLTKKDCFDNVTKDLCISKRAGALDDEFPRIVHACGSNNVTYVSKDDLLCAAKTMPGLKLLHSGVCL